MLKFTKISEIMTRNVFSVDIQDTLKSADEIMKSEKLHHIPVLENNRYIGMLEHQKIYEYTLRRLYDFEDDPESTSQNIIQDFQNLLNKDLKLLYPEDSIQKALEVFTKNSYECLPVVDWDKNLVGIISTVDILLFLHKAIKEGVIS
ncbi:MAG: hypothetical protein A2X64_07860 [Ignavibacteria bacterium GWF2_33_9]|nr:MAG: hypothetical protein A2X64_07860 [Ignavibacteria bacterium GWF2_33_9]